MPNAPRAAMICFLALAGTSACGTVETALQQGGAERSPPPRVSVRDDEWQPPAPPAPPVPPSGENAMREALDVLAAALPPGQAQPVRAAAAPPAEPVRAPRPVRAEPPAALPPQPAPVPAALPIARAPRTPVVSEPLAPPPTRPSGRFLGRYDPTASRPASPPPAALLPTGRSSVFRAAP